MELLKEIDIFSKDSYTIKNLIYHFFGLSIKNVVIIKEILLKSIGLFIQTVSLKAGD